MGRPDNHWFPRGAAWALRRLPAPVVRIAASQVARRLARRPGPFSSELGPAGQVVRGARSIPVEFQPFVEAFESSYGAQVLWVSADRIAGSGRPRLRVTVLEANGDVLTTPENAGFGPPQPIRDLLTAHVPRQDLPDLFGVHPRSCEGDRAWDDMHVVLLDFSRSETYRVLGQVTHEERRIFGDGLGLGEDLWLVEASSWWPVVFVQTDAQVAAIDADQVKSWAEKYVEIVRPHDDLGLIRAETSSIRVDSKQNFDTNFESNWHYYFN